MMAADDYWTNAMANQMLVEATENVFSNNTQVVNDLLKTNRELFSQDVLDKSLLSCCRNGLLHLMPAIISAGANLELTNRNGNTPLLMCVLNRHECCARCLIGAGANVNAVNFFGNTPLILSVMHRCSIEMISLLVGNSNTIIDFTNNDGYSALLYAIETANLNAMRLLIDAGFSSETKKASYDSFLKDVANRKGLLRLYNLFQLQKETGKPSLLHAAMTRDLESAHILISMDDSSLNTNILIELLNSIQENNNVVYHSDVEMFVFLFNHVTAKSASLDEKELIIDMAISIGNHEIVESLSQFDFVVSCDQLVSAISKPDFLRLLLTKRHIINKFDLDNQPVYVGSPLHQAMIENEIESAKALIQHGAFIDIDQALEDVVKGNLENVIYFLLSVFPDQVGQKLKSPKMLHDAVINSSTNIIPILVDNGVDINAQYNRKYCLTQVVDVNVLELLLSRGADPNIQIDSNPYTYPLHIFLSSEFKRELKDKWTSLQTDGVTNSFLNKEYKAFVQCLLNYGARVDLKDGQGQAALHIAAAKGHTVGILNILIDAGADVNIVDNYGQTPLHISVGNENVKKLNCLLLYKAKVDIKNNNGQTALQIASSKSNSADILKILIEYGADVNTIDNNGETPLSNAVENEMNENVKILIDAGADINFVRKITGQSVLFDATNGPILEALLNNGADVRTINGESPLNSLLVKSNIGAELVKRLIEAGCDVNHVNKDGDSVLITATIYVDIKLLEVLVEKGANVNASGRKYPYLTAVIGLLLELGQHQYPEQVFSGVEYLIDHDANIDNVHFAIIYVFITFGCLSLIPKFISRGCAPTYLQVKPCHSFLINKTHISPLMMALLMDQSELAQYFINIKYLMKSDIAILNGEMGTQRELEKNFLENSLDLLKTVCQQPLSLETLCSVVISDILGPTQDRRLKIQKLELTQPVKDLLIFKNVGKCHIKNVGKTDNDLFEMSLNYFLSEHYGD